MEHNVMGKKASTADVEKAFTAGFENKDFISDAEVIEEEVVAIDKVATTTKSTETIVEEKPTEKPNTEVDPWEGISDTMRVHFETMEASVKQANDIAKSASGRANKLQSVIDKQSRVPVAAPKPTKDQILEALANKEKRDVLREDFEGFAEALDEMDQSVSTAVGSALDGLRKELRQEAIDLNNESMNELAVKRTLDIKHPGWETTINDKDFKGWVYEGGPNEQEITQYEAILNQARSATVQDRPMMNRQASDYYQTLLDSNPVWASKKGSLYGDSSGESAVALLDNFQLSKPQAEIEAPAEIVDMNKQRLMANIVPTTGNSRQAPVSDAADVEKAFSEGFNNSTY